MSVLEALPLAEAEAISQAADLAGRGIMNYYVGFNAAGEYRVFDGRDWLMGHGTEEWEIRWGVWSSGTLVRDPGRPAPYAPPPPIGQREGVNR